MILNRQRVVRVAIRPLEQFLARVKRELGLTEIDITICLVGDAEIARMNQAFRGKKGATDVLSFPVEKRRRGAGPRRKKSLPEFLGDIAISPATARRNSKRFERSVASELRVLILHGVLHLLGYDHETDTGQMDRMEMRLRKRLGLT